MVVPTWLYASIIAILMMIWLCVGWLKYDNGYSYVLIELLVTCVKVKYVVSCLGWLVSFTWCLYEYEYVISWLRMLNSLSLECMSDMWPWMMLRGSFMWNPESNGKIMYVEVVSRNGIRQSKGMMDLRLISWNGIILILRKVIMSFLSPL